MQPALKKPLIFCWRGLWGACAVRELQLWSLPFTAKQCQKELRITQAKTLNQHCQTHFRHCCVYPLKEKNKRKEKMSSHLQGNWKYIRKRIQQHFQHVNMAKWTGQNWPLDSLWLDHHLVNAVICFLFPRSSIVFLLKLYKNSLQNWGRGSRNPY